MQDEMPKSNNTGIGSAVEREMHRQMSAPSALGASNPAAQSKNAEAEKNRQQALARRLEQLRSAMGDPAPDAAATAQAPVPTPAPASDWDATPTTEPDRVVAPSSSTRTVALGLAFTALVAGALWWTLGDTPPVEVAATAAPSPAPEVAPAAPVAPATVEPAPVAAAPAVAPPVAPAEVATPEEQVLKLVEAWRLAWSSRDADAYLSHYSPNFAPANGQARADWAEGRRKNFAARQFIDVKTQDMQVTPLGEQRIQLSFLQDYDSGNYQETAQPKTFLLVLEDKQWRIAGEWQGTRQVPNQSKP